ncbi:hypothetical protein HNR42_001324 [Deinobacterium chartae]|uniref:Uncharacterized protein n=1 Tax=Deinobacterium chartae TaxID=521158 RepID=A0A841HWJ3_9DEIO|nr:hypothetical protein [Deinobacterium chartae]MBB6097901.1 hypothetical protein [Deinobacterium chartae]
MKQLLGILAGLLALTACGSEISDSPDGPVNPTVYSCDLNFRNFDEILPGTDRSYEVSYALERSGDATLKSVVFINAAGEPEAVSVQNTWSQTVTMVSGQSPRLSVSGNYFSGSIKGTMQVLGRGYTKIQNMSCSTS